MTKQWKGTGLREGAVRLMATDLGIDPDLAVKAGQAAAKVLGALSDAGACDCPHEKTDGTRRAQKHLRTIDPAKHGPLVQQLQARLLAFQGRGGDTEVAHVTPGELVLPPNLQTPAVMALLEQAAAAHGIDMARLFVGHVGNSVNPRTGAREFAGRGVFHEGSMFENANRPGFGMGGWPTMTNSIVNEWMSGFGPTIQGRIGRSSAPFDSVATTPWNIAPPRGYQPGPPPPGEQIMVVHPAPQNHWIPGNSNSDRIPQLVSNPIDKDGNFVVPRYDICKHLTEDVRAQTPGCEEIIENIRVPILPAIPQQEELSKKSMQTLIRERQWALIKLQGLEMAGIAGDAALKRHPFWALIAYFGVDVVKSRFEEIVYAYDQAIADLRNSGGP